MEPMDSPKEALKQRICQAVDQAAEEVKAYADDVGAHPELGYFEYRTSDRFAQALEGLGLEISRGLARTGLRTDLAGSSEGPKIAVIGELDGIVCRNHPLADPETGASHSCGHNLQTAAVLALAAAFTRTEAMKELAGAVALFGMPAEEYIEISRRMALREAGEISYLCGKPELVSRGLFDDVSMAMMVHAGDNAPEPGFTVPSGGNGFRVFTVQYIGRQAHAAAAPHLGINALYAAVAGINAVNALRETFKDDDHVRVHFIITKGGDSVNSVPDDVRLEGYVRGRTVECIDSTFAKVQRAFMAGAEALGAECRFSSIPGDMPLNCSEGLNSLFAANAASLVGPERVQEHTYFSASTDMGDLTHLMPAIHPSAGGVVGALHAPEFQVVDFDAAVLMPAKAMAMTVVDLLWDGAAQAKEILQNFKALYTKEQYLQAMDSRFFQG